MGFRVGGLGFEVQGLGFKALGCKALWFGVSVSSEGLLGACTVNMMLVGLRLRFVWHRKGIQSLHHVCRKTSKRGLRVLRVCNPCFLKTRQILFITKSIN